MREQLLKGCKRASSFIKSSYPKAPASPAAPQRLRGVRPLVRPRLALHQKQVASTSSQSLCKYIMNVYNQLSLCNSLNEYTCIQNQYDILNLWSILYDLYKRDTVTYTLIRCTSPLSAWSCSCCRKLHITNLCALSLIDTIWFTMIYCTII